MQRPSPHHQHKELHSISNSRKSRKSRRIKCINLNHSLACFLVVPLVVTLLNQLYDNEMIITCHGFGLGVTIPTQTKLISTPSLSRPSLPHSYHSHHSHHIQHIQHHRTTTSLLSSTASKESSSSQSSTTSTTMYKNNNRNRRKIKKQQKENEIELQLLSKKPTATMKALDFYYSIWDEYHNYLALEQQLQPQQQQTQSDNDNGKGGGEEEEDILPFPPTVRLMNHAIDACARAQPNPLTKEALEIFTKATTSSSTLTSTKSTSTSTTQLIPNVYTFGSLIRAYARVGDVTKCRQILNEMKHNYDQTIIPNSVIYSTIISACEHVNYVNNDYDNVDVNLALRLFQEAIIDTSNRGVSGNRSRDNSSGSRDSNRNTNRSNNDRRRNDSQKVMDMNIVVYNTVLSVFAKAGEWKLACQLLDEMEGCERTAATSTPTTGMNGSTEAKRIVPIPSNGKIINIPRPDHITYGTVMAACERANEWNRVLKIAQRVKKHDYYQLDGVSLSSALKACQQLGYADDALEYLNQMKELSNSSSNIGESNTNGNASGNTNSNGSSNTNGHHHYNHHRRKPLQGPDDVAYRLAISACARSGYINNTNGDNTSSPPRWIDGIKLLREMEQVTGSSPDVIAYTAAISGCAVAGEYIRAIQLLKEMKRKRVEPNVVTFTAVISACASACAKKSDDDEKNNNNVDSSTSTINDELMMKAAPMKKALAILDHMTREGSSLDIQPNIVTYNTAIRACAEGLNVYKAFALLDELKARNLEPTIVTYGTLMTACERVGDVDGARKVFRFMKDAEMKPNEIIYGAAISCYRKASKSDVTFRLLCKMLDEELSPNTATFNTVLMSQTEAKDIKNAIEIYDLMESSQYGNPNRQTYNLLIRYLTMISEPSKAEYFLNKMRENGMKPDVNLFTATVTAFEKNREPRKALSLMESMREEGYDFYDIKVLDVAFKQGVKLINNVVGNSLTEQVQNDDDTTTMGETWFNESDFAK